MLKTSDFDYNLPKERIAQTPIEPRDHARLLVFDRNSQQVDHNHFYNLIDYLNPGDLLVVNQTRVIPARLYAQKLPGLGKLEILLLRKLDDCDWECLIGGKGMKVGRALQVIDGPKGLVIEVLEGSKRVLRFEEAIEPFFAKAGHVPLPPYIHGYVGDPERYQTVFNKTPGSAAAPTAGLHFTAEVLEKIAKKGIQTATVDLQVGLDTFAPVTEELVKDHHIHTEWCSVSQETVDLIAQTKSKGGRVIAVGTTSVRALETLGQNQDGQALKPWEGDTALYILPGYEFRLVDAMITNFHLPKSTLLMLVSAFAGREQMLALYQMAISENYRFFSFGDAMLLM
jgi:S-adenosylmethionine:tRNA ribosyltransferase-isomerase